MTAFILLFVILFIADPVWVGKYLSEVRFWYDYYRANKTGAIRQKLIKTRAMNIARIRKEKVRNKK